MDLAAIARRVPSLKRLGTETVLLSGGEPLLNPEWQQIAELLKEAGFAVWLLTSGLSLVKHAPQAARLFDNITVSLDGTDPDTYASIRGLDAFHKVTKGIRAAAEQGTPASVRVTLQRANFRQLSGFVELARRLGARQVSFLAVDVANPHAFARSEGPRADLALRREDLPVFEAALNALEQDFAADFSTGFIAESPGKLRSLVQYFAAVCGGGEPPPVRCNAPEFSAVIGADGRVSPCFFIPGPSEAAGDDIESALNGTSLRVLRASIRAGARQECIRCVCSLWRDPTSFAAHV